MTKEIKYKLQGDGRDSWEISEYEGDLLVNRYMVYEDPNIGKTTDIVSLLKTQTPEQLSEIKKLLGL